MTTLQRHAAIKVAFIASNILVVEPIASRRCIIMLYVTRRALGLLGELLEAQSLDHELYMAGICFVSDSRLCYAHDPFQYRHFTTVNRTSAQSPTEINIKVLDDFRLVEVKGSLSPPTR